MDYLSFCGRLGFVLLLSAIFSTSIIQAQGYKLNDTLPPNGDVETFSISPNGDWVVYLADQNEEGVTELFRVPIAGGETIKINLPLTPGGDVLSYQISRDSSRVVYLADLSIDGVPELFSVPLHGGETVKLSMELVSGDVISRYGISPDSSRVVYPVKQNGLVELYSSRLTGGHTVKLNSELVEGGEVILSFLISPDSNRVVYLADQDIDRVTEIYSVPLAGGVAVKLNPTLPLGRRVSIFFSITPNSETVVFRSDLDVGNVMELYGVPLLGGTATKLNAPLVAGVEILYKTSISPDSTRVVYLTEYIEQDNYNSYELYSANLGSGAVIKLNPELSPGKRVSHFWISPNSSHVVYLADLKTDSILELFSVPIDGGTAINLSPQKVKSGGGNVIWFLKISPDSSRVVYLADLGAGAGLNLYSSRLADGVTTKLNPSLVSGGDVGFWFKISPDSKHVVYQADQQVNGVDELFSVQIDGGKATNLNPELTIDGDVIYSKISRDSGRVLYLADQQEDEVTELYSAFLEVCPSHIVANLKQFCQANIEGISDWDTQAGISPGISQSVTFPPNEEPIEGIILDLTGLTHTHLGDLSVELIAPDGTSMFVVGKFTGLSAEGDNTNYLGGYSFQDGALSLRVTAASFSDSDNLPALAYAPSEDDSNNLEQINSFFTTFGGKNAEGEWTVRFHDNSSSDESGHLVSWSLTLLTKSSSFYIVPLKNNNSVIFEL